MKTKISLKVLLQIIILLFTINFGTISFAQEDQIWMRNYRLSKECLGESLIETYDQGYLLAGRLSPNSPPYSYLLKVDKNGNELWHKAIGDGKGNCFAIQKIVEDKNGYIYIYQLFIVDWIVMEILV